MPEKERLNTWQDLMKFVDANGLGREEYFDLRPSAQPDAPIWAEGTRWIAVYWVEGDSEGYYVHVDTIVHDRSLGKDIATRMALGKFWAKASASMAVAILTPAIYGLNLV